MTFSSWQKDGASFSSPITITSSGTYTAKYTGKPADNVLGTHLSSTVNEPVVVYWTDYGNTNVTQYKVYRKIRQSNGSYGAPVLLATLGRGVQQYTDNDYVVAASYIDFIAYQVKAYYSPDQTYSDDCWVSTFADEGLQAKMENPSDKKMVTKELPSEYSLNNYPNPFNPTTTINYQLPSDGMVTLKVYDVIGKEVTTLVDGHRAAGTYNIEFNASDLPSGVYIYRLSANNPSASSGKSFTQSKKMLLVK